MSEPPVLSHGFMLGPYRVMPRQEEIQGPEETHHLEPKVMQVLLVLATHAQQPVTRESLLETVWAGTVVGDEVVSRAVSLLRGYLGDERTKPRFIRTIPKTGYELIHPVVPLQAQEPQPGDPSAPAAATSELRPTSAAGGATPQRRRYWVAAAALITLTSVLVGLLSLTSGRQTSATVAVLPFNINGNREALSYLREGLADYLINQLSQASNLQVVAKRSSFANFDATIDARGLGSVLGADYIIDGTLEHGDAQHVKATVYLVDTDSGTNRASSQVEWASADIPGLQQAMLQSALDALSRVLRVRFDAAMAQPEPVDPAAYRAYLEAKYQWSLRGEARIRRAIGLLQEAIRLEPRFADAQLALAQALAIEPFYTTRPIVEGFAAARGHAGRAEALAPALKPDVDALEGYMLKQEWRWDEALTRLERALEADPDNVMANYWYSTLLSTLGRFEEALPYIQAAHQQDPVSPFLNDRLALANVWLGNLDVAAERYEVAARLGYLESIQPKSLFVFMHRTGRFDELRQLLLRQGYGADWVTPFIEALRNPARLAAATPVLEAAMARGEIPEALRFGIWAFLGDADRALANFQLDPKTPDIEYLWSPDSAFLREHPDFPALLDKLNLSNRPPTPETVRSSVREPMRGHRSSNETVLG